MVSGKFDCKVELDFSGLTRLEKSVKQLNSRHIRWGWLDSKKYPSTNGRASVSVAQVANWAEYGTVKQPPRPYFRQAIYKSAYDYNDQIKEIFRDSLKGLVNHISLNKLANDLVKDYHESVLKQNFRSLAEYTVTVKGHTYQMDHTGLMLSSFKARVYKQSIDAVREPYDVNGGR